MGEARRRGTYADRRADPKDPEKTGTWRQDLTRWFHGARKKKQRPQYPKRERARMRRRVKRRLGYTRRDVDRIAQESDAGIDPPDSYIEALVEEGF